MAKFKKVDIVPEKIKKARLKADWQEFMDANIKIAMVDLKQYNYKSVDVARTVMACSVKRFGLPIDVVKRGDEIYLVRRDM